MMQTFIMQMVILLAATLVFVAAAWLVFGKDSGTDDDWDWDD